MQLRSPGMEGGVWTPQLSMSFTAAILEPRTARIDFVSGGEIYLGEGFGRKYEWAYDCTSGIRRELRWVWVYMGEEQSILV